MDWLGLVQRAIRLIWALWGTARTFGRLDESWEWNTNGCIMFQLKDLQKQRGEERWTRRINMQGGIARRGPGKRYLWDLGSGGVVGVGTNPLLRSSSLSCRKSCVYFTCAICCRYIT